VGLGLAGPFTRPVRTLAMAAAVVFGASAVTFAFGLAQSLQRVQTGVSRDGAADVSVDVITAQGQQNGEVHVGAQSGGKGGPDGGAPNPPQSDPAAVKAAIAEQPDTASFFGIAHLRLVVSGVTGASNVELMDGAPAGTYPIISGSWFTGPGQAVVPTRFLESTGTHLGSAITISDAGRQIPVRIVGEVFDTGDQGMDVLTDFRTVSAVDGSVGVDTYDIKLKPGTNHATYVSFLNAKIHPIGGDAQDTALESKGKIFVLLDGMIALLTTMLVIVAGLAVLNTVVLETRERVHDLGVYKAVGMTPRQTIAMVLSSVAVVGLLAGIVGVPAGIALHDYVLPVMGHAAGTNLPHEYMAVYTGSEAVLLGLGGLAIAVVGAMLPAGWAARTRTATALRTE
ncbi:MAG: ABC transporter permease, partial [Actinocrinis sp.]